MVGAHHKAIVINHWWAGILSALLMTFIGGTASIAKDMYDAQASGSRERAILAEKVQPMVDAKLPERVTRIEETVQNTNSRVESIDRKLDVLIQRQLEDRTTDRNRRGE